MIVVQAPCAIDSGARADVSPPKIFSLKKSRVKLGPKFFGAGGSPLENLGVLVAQEANEECFEMRIDFDIAVKTKPLPSVHKMANNGRKIILHDTSVYIRVKVTNTRVNLRRKAKLFMLDLRATVRQELGDSKPIVLKIQSLPNHTNASKGD